ncbi:hypothetical protein OS493_039362 [Desmophyllum pertusum]|uniref:Uncharacterized protein n=1 Tax=Desmophyllum pertusum TaxID=174260 RepID=A0A9W9YX78_9CNID|nr:hypothetical protein OS493_039362 [Desmophyllum pertusum]
MQWIKHKKEERMAVAAKVIGAVRLGLVDIRVVIEELDTEEMQRVPEIHMQVYEVLKYKHMPSHYSKFAVEKVNCDQRVQFLLQFCLRLKCSILMLKPKHGNLLHPQHRQFRQIIFIVESLLAGTCLLLSR